MDRPGTTYTVDTIAALKRLYGDDVNLYFIIGADTLLELESWRDFPRIAVQTDFIVFARGGISHEQTQQTIQHLEKRYCNQYIQLGMHASGLSSTQLRNAIEKQRWDGEGAHPSVYAYIKETGLYQNIPCLNRDQVLQRLSKSISKSRLEHTLGVERTALELAVRHHVSMQLAARAALLHDCAKLSPGHDAAPYHQAVANLGLQHQAEQYGMDILHGSVGAAWARRIYGEQDPQVLAAITCHTFGKVGMSALDKVICLADMIEPGRDFEGVDQLRAAAEKDLDQAMLLMYQMTATYVMQRRQVLHPDMIIAYNAIVSQNQQTVTSG